MKYIKPELNIEKIEILENITEDLISSTGNLQPWFEDDDENMSNLGGEVLGEVFDNIFGI